MQRTLSFEPVQAEDGRFRCFWSLDSGWGEFVMAPDAVEVRVLYGSLDVQALRLPFLANQSVQSIRVGAQTVAFTQTGDAINLAGVTRIGQGQALQLQ